MPDASIVEAPKGYVFYCLMKGVADDNGCKLFLGKQKMSFLFVVPFVFSIEILPVGSC